MQIDLSDQDVQNLLEVLMSSTGVPWKLTHPLIMKIGAQQQQAAQRPQMPPAMRGNSGDDGTGDFDPERRAADTFRPTN